MSDQPETPQPATARPGEPEVTTMRRAPRVGVFLAFGVGLGVLVALILTFAFDGTLQPSDIEISYTKLQVLGFLLLFTVPIGIALGGIVAWILDRTVGRKTRTVRVSRDVIITPDDE